MPTTENPHRLPRTVVPRRYDLRLEPDLEAATFAGSETVAVEVTEPTAEIVLNAAELTIDEATVTAGGERLVATVSLDEKAERATLRLERPVPAGEAAVELRFRGVLNDKLVGFYRSTFVGRRRRRCSPARRWRYGRPSGLPCWDEPDSRRCSA